MKKIGMAMLASISSITFAFDYPELFDPTQQKFLELYIKDRNDLVKEDLFSPSGTKQEWPCPISQKEQYRLANQLLNEPLVQEKKPNTQHHLDNSSQNETTIINSNVQITPLKAKCVNGKISGDLVLRIEYDDLLDQYLAPNQTRLISKIHNITFSSGTLKDGSLTGIAKSYSKFITQLKLVNPSNPDKKEFGNPIVSLIMNYKDNTGNEASFSEETGFYISGEQTQNLKSTFISVIDKNHTRKTTYKNNHISSIESFKNKISHGDQLGYFVGMDDKISLIEAELPNSHPKLVTINGINYLETHLCMQNGLEVDTFPCITEDNNKIQP